MVATVRKPETRLERVRAGEHEIVSPDDRMYYATALRGPGGWRLYDDGGRLTDQTFPTLADAHEWFRREEL